MTSPAADAWRAALEEALHGGSLPALEGISESLLDGALRDLVRRHGAAAAPLVRRLADAATPKAARKVARRALYRLGQAGVELPPSSASAITPIFRPPREHAVRAWLSGIDGSGSRAAWIVFEGGMGGERRLCSLILNDEAGILEVAGGPITKKRLEAELASLRESQKLPWVETAPDRACALVADALALHERARTSPPPEFQRFRPLFEGVAPLGETAGAAAVEIDAPLLSRSGELLMMPELLGWFVDPAAVQEEAVARLEMQDSRLIVSDQIKAEREAAIVDRAIGRAFDAEARPRLARRLVEMALVFRATGRAEPARVAETAAAALRDEARPVEGIPLVRALALRGLEVAGEVTLGRVKLSDVSRAPGPRPGA